MPTTRLARLQTAVIGVGLMGRLFAHLLRQSPYAQLVALAEADPSLHAELATQFEVPVYGDCHELLNAVPLDAAVVATSDQAHLKPSLAILQREIPLFLEKPLALTVSDAMQIVAAAEASGVPLMVGHVLRFDPRFVLLHDAVVRGELGEIQLIHGRREAPLAEGQRLAGRTSLAFYVGVHDIDAIHWITRSRVTQVAAVYQGVVPGLPHTGGSLSATLWLESGASATLQHAWVLPDSPYRIHQQLFEVIGTSGTARLDALDDGLRLDSRGRINHPSAHYLFGPLLYGRITGVYRDELEHFLDCLQRGGIPAVRGEDGVAAVAVAAAIDEAAQTGVRCDVDYPL